MTVTTEEKVRAFNAGCDARIAGDRLARNPYTVQSKLLYEQWRFGWHHVDYHWGMDAKGRPIRELSPVY